jgi:hypothetical protein
MVETNLADIKVTSDIGRKKFSRYPVITRSLSGIEQAPAITKKVGGGGQVLQRITNHLLFAL